MRCNAELYYIGKIPPMGIGLQQRMVLKRFYGALLQQHVVLQWFYPSEQLCRRYMHSMSALLVLFFYWWYMLCFLLTNMLVI